MLQDELDGMLVALDVFAAAAMVGLVTSRKPATTSEDIAREAFSVAVAAVNERLVARAVVTRIFNSAMTGK